MGYHYVGYLINFICLLLGERERKIYMQNDIPTYLYHVQYLTL